MVSFVDGHFILLHSDFDLYIDDVSRFNSKYCFSFFIGDSSIIKTFDSLSDLCSFALDILHIFGFTSLTGDIFIHPEEYIY